MRWTTLILASVLATAACGRLNGDDNNSNDSDGGNSPTGVPAPGPGADTQELIPLQSLELTPTREVYDGETIETVNELLDSTSVEVTGFREIILYGLEYVDANGAPYEMPKCKLTDGTETFANFWNTYFDVRFGMSAEEQLPASYTNDLMKLTRHPVSGNWLSLAWDRKSDTISPIDPGTTPRPTVDKTTCKGKYVVKVVGVR